MERNSFVLYRSFMEAIEELDAAEQGVAWRVLSHYALNGEIPQSDVPQSVRALFVAFKSQIDVNNTRYENGCKGAEYGARGGRPKNPKEPPKKPQNNPNLTPNDNDNDNDNVNVNDNDNGVGGKLPQYVRTHEGGGKHEVVKMYYTEFKEEILGDTTTSMELQRLYGKTKGELLKYLDTFQSLQSVNKEVYANRTLYRSHFNKWMHIQILNSQSYDQSQPKQQNGYKSETEKIINNANYTDGSNAGYNDIK